MPDHGIVNENPVAVIFSLTARADIERLAQCMPVWVIDSKENAAAVQIARRQFPSGLTLFFRLPGESESDRCSRVLFDVDDHHQFSCLEIYGLPLSQIDPITLYELGIRAFTPTDYGCKLNRG
jgi:hypothetical protein